MVHDTQYELVYHYLKPFLVKAVICLTTKLCPHHINGSVMIGMRVASLCMNGNKISRIQTRSCFECNWVNFSHRGGLSNCKVFVTHRPNVNITVVAGYLIDWLKYGCMEFLKLADYLEKGDKVLEHMLAWICSNLCTKARIDNSSLFHCVFVRIRLQKLTLISYLPFFDFESMKKS